METNATGAAAAARLETLIPVPASLFKGEGTFLLTAATRLIAGGEALDAAQFLAERLNPATGFQLAVQSPGGATAVSSITLTTSGVDPALGEEGYELTITPAAVRLAAYRPAGLFWGVQTLRQLLPPAIEASGPRAGPWAMAAATIRDLPRFEWRGLMLDVARHFFGVNDVKRLIDLAAYYKLNRLHLHLSDDQGWRVMIDAWPRLAEVGGSSAVGGDPGGYYTQAEYADLAAYAAGRQVVLVPEFDLPGHTNAALAAYPELNCDGIAPALYTGTQVGFSSLCIDKEITYTLVDDVVREIGALTPGPYFHIGGDETMATPPADYLRFVERVQAIVAARGKRMVGWEEIAAAKLLPGTVAQYWKSGLARQAAEIIFSPAAKTYLDMKYDQDTPLGLTWAGKIEVRDSYDWEPAAQLSGVSESAILGVEAPLWSETLRTLADVEYMLFPRLPGLAEIGWSPRAGRGWDEYRARLTAHAPRFEALGIHYYRSPQVEWK